MGQVYSRDDVQPYSRVEAEGGPDAIEVVHDEDGDEGGGGVGGCSFICRCFKALWTRKSRKRKRSRESEIRQRTKVIRLDASTATDSRTRESESQTDVKTTSVQTDETLTEVNMIPQEVHKTDSKEESVKDWLTFPFLDDRRSIQHCQVSRVMLLMRGLPGSGKSTIVKHIKKQFPQCVTCSADDYFMEDGVYNFRVNELKYAHESSQQKCEEYCAEGRLLVVVDNTNVKRWEMAPYFSIAERYRYTVVLVEPQTPWKFDVDELVARNSHGVGREVLVKRIKDYQLITPRYFGWFLNRGDSVGVLSLANTILLRCLQTSQNFFETFRKFSGCDTLEQMLDYFSRDKCAGAGADILHTTAKFFKKGEGMEYLDKQELKDNLGKTTILKIGGFSISSQTFGAKLMLTASQKALWAQNDMEMQRSGGKGSKPNGTFTKNTQKSGRSNYDDSEDFLLSSLRISTTKVDEDNSVLGRRAHITLGTRGVPPVETGLDVIHAVTQVSSLKEFSSVDLPSGNGLVGGRLIQLNSSHWYLQLDRYILVNAMFTGSY